MAGQGAAGEKTAFVTGVSTGIGFGLAEEMLKRGWRVLGLSRREPAFTEFGDQFSFRSVDLTESETLAANVMGLLAGVPRIDLAVLNAGVLGAFGDLADATLEDLQNTMNVNVWSNKLILDALFAEGRSVEQVVTISSGAAVNGHRGWSGYSISKAALNMFTRLYAKEQPRTHFCAFAPGVVDTPIQDQLLSLQSDDRFPSLEYLRAKRGTDDMPGPAEAARRLLAAFERLPAVVSSGDFADIRSLAD